MTAHNDIVYEPLKNKPFARGLEYAVAKECSIREGGTLVSVNDIGCSESTKVLKMHTAASEAPVVLVGNNSTHLENASIIIRMWALSSTGRGPMWSMCRLSNRL
jgi:hypothetical protein